MSWKDFDKLLNELFDSFYQKKSDENEVEETNNLSKPTEEFIQWLDNHIDTFDSHNERYEDFERSRLCCTICLGKIEDDRFLVISDPNFPNDHTKSLYFHSTDNCNLRLRMNKFARERWLSRRKFKE